MRQYYLKYRWLRWSLRTAASIVALIFIAWSGLAVYVNTHKQELLRQITGRLGERLQGRISARDMEPSFWHSFPQVSVSLKDVSLRDSLWERHHHSLLDVKDLYVQVNTFALLSRRVEIQKITAAHGTAFLYADSSGYSNAYLLERKDTTKKNHTTLLDHFGLEDLHFYYINEQKAKDFHLYISSLDGRTTESAGAMHFAVKAAAHVYLLAFSTARGSYLKGEELHIDERLDYYINQKRLDIPLQFLGIDNSGIMMNGRFYFDRSPSVFELHFHSDALSFADAQRWMAPNIAKLMSRFSFSKPLTLQADISGPMQYLTIPLLRISLGIRDNVMGTPLGAIESMSADLQFYNEYVPGRGHGDDNSEMRFTSLKGRWRGLPFAGDTVAVHNLLVPFVNAHITSGFPLASLNGILGAETFSFDKGNAAADLHYVGGIIPEDTTAYSLNGFVKFSDAALTYIPRAMSFSNAAAKIFFEGDNLFLRDVTLRTKASSIAMEGDALHFLHLYFSDPEKILVRWQARSPQIDLNEFVSFAEKRPSESGRKGRPGGISRIGNQLDRVLNASSIDIDARIEKLLFRRFTATGVVAKATLAQNGIAIEKVALQEGEGALEISGAIRQSEADNPFSLKATITNADVAGFLRAFDNFGQEAIVADNLRGKLFATVALSGRMSDAAVLQKNSLKGRLVLTLKEGELNNYAPLGKISRFIFKRRSLDHLVFEDLKATLDIDGNNINIQPMNVSTSAIEMQMGGTYSLSGSGTNIAMQIPLRNPLKEKAKTPFGKLLRTGRGFIVHLRARDGGTSGVKIGWDPLQKGNGVLADSLKLD